MANFWGPYQAVQSPRKFGSGIYSSSKLPFVQDPPLALEFILITERKVDGVGLGSSLMATKQHTGEQETKACAPLRATQQLIHHQL
jgi:hypothetical protein